MKIIHYCFGLPPYSTGGLSIYAKDLASIQSENNEVIVLFPGLKKSKLSLKKVNYINKKIKLYRLDGLLPSSINYGIKEPLDFIGNKDIKEIEKIFDKFGFIDILHIHTLQGLYPEVIKYFKNKNTKIVYTTHDFLPFSLTTKYYLDKEMVINSNLEQSIKAPSTKALYLIRNPFFNKLKKIKILKKIFNKKVKGDKLITYDLEYKNNYLKKRNELYKFYENMMNDIDIIHANSNLSKEIYQTKFKNIKVINITHNSIMEHSLIKNKNDILNIGFFGEGTKDKGFLLLLRVLDKLYNDNFKFVLNFYGPANLNERPYLKYHGAYKFSELDNIYKNIDLVIMPAINVETFSFVVLEALSYKTPTIVSNSVGAKDLCNKDFIINSGEDLYNLLTKILNDKNILNNYFNYELKIESLKMHNDKIINEIYKGGK